MVNLWGSILVCILGIYFLEGEVIVLNCVLVLVCSLIVRWVLKFVMCSIVVFYLLFVFCRYRFLGWIVNVVGLLESDMGRVMLLVFKFFVWILLVRRFIWLMKLVMNFVWGCL